MTDAGQPVMQLATSATFAWPDWLVLGGYFVVLLLTGIYFSRRRLTDTDDYFLGGRRMPAWAVAFSVLATSLSAATFVGGPQQSYAGDLRYLSASIGGIFAAVIVAAFFIPAFYRYGVTTVYELLEHRYGRSARQTASWAFMVGRIFASGARLYIAALAASLILFGGIEPKQMAIAIAVLVVVGIVYTFVGGISTVIWTDVIQTFIFVGAAGAALVVLLAKIPVDLSVIVDALQSPPDGGASKLKLLEVGVDPGRPNFGFDPATRYTLLTAVFGFTLFNLAAYGTDQDLAQRMLTCRSARRGSWSMIAAILGGIPVTLLFMVVGLLLYIFYARPDVMGAAAPEQTISDDREVFLQFIMAQMPRGMSGLMMAGLFASALSSLNSALNAMSSTFVSDFYRGFNPGRSQVHYVYVGRAAVIVWGVVLGGFATLCIFWQQQSGTTLIDFSLAVMTFAYCGLAGVFLAALFTRRGNAASAIAAIIIGAIVILALQPGLWAPMFPGHEQWQIGEKQIGQIVIAFPWRMAIATCAAFAVCCIGSRRTAPRH